MFEYLPLILASIAFVGSHFLMSHPMRGKMVAIFGANGFQGVYSAVSILTLLAMIFAFRHAPTGNLLWGVGDIFWIISSMITLVAAILFSGSFSGNPALPSPGAEKYAARKPAGVFLVTRHPMMWSFALWGMAHILIAPRADIFIFIGSIIFLALVGAKKQEAKKAKIMSDRWDGWLRQTSYWPKFGAFVNVGFMPWIMGVIIWFAATWAHAYFGAPAAGIFRWF